VPASGTRPRRTYPETTAPRPYARKRRRRRDDLIDFTPAPREKALAGWLAKNYKLGPAYTPPVGEHRQGGRLGPGTLFLARAAPTGHGRVVGSRNPHGRHHTLQSCLGATACSRRRGTERKALIMWSAWRWRGQPVNMIKGPGEEALGGRAPAPPKTPGPEGWRRRKVRRLSVDGLPLLKPPYRRSARFNSYRRHRLAGPAREAPDFRQQQPELKGLNIPSTGPSTATQIGTLVHKSMVIAGRRRGHGPRHPPTIRAWAMMRAYDKASGKGSGGGLDCRAAKNGTRHDYSVKRQAAT